VTFAADKALQQAAIDSILGSASTYLANLQAVANTVLIEGTTILPVQYDYASVPMVNFPLIGATRPTNIAVIGAVPPPDAPSFAFSSLSAVALPVDDLLAPTAVFTFAEAPYASILLDPLKAKLLDNLLNGGYGIEPADEIALFNRARDREVEAMMSRISDAGRAMAARGFPLPPGELSIHVDRAYQEMQDKVSDVSRDITLARNKLFVENRQFTVNQIRELEQITMNYWNSVQERAFNVARIAAEFAITVYNALIARYRARLEASKITSDVQLQMAQTETARVQATLEGYRGQIVAYEANLRRLIDPARLQVDLYGHDVDAARVTNDGTIARAQLQMKVLEATVQQNIQISNMTIENARVRLLGVIDSLKFKTAAAQFGSDRFFALLTALETTVNTLSVSTSTQ
jgi:hypothetical protein